jgi:hypothetical protein
MNNFPTNIRDYAKLYHGVIPTDICEQTIKSLKDAQWDIHQFVTAKDGIYTEDKIFCIQLVILLKKTQ